MKPSTFQQDVSDPTLIFKADGKVTCLVHAFNGGVQMTEGKPFLVDFMIGLQENSEAIKLALETTHSGLLETEIHRRFDGLN
jgi:hypothetical protein